MSEYNNIKITEENIDEICDRILDESSSEYELLFNSLDNILEVYNSNIYIYITLIEIMKEIKEFYDLDLMYESRSRICCIKSLLTKIDQDIRYHPLEEMISKAQRMIDIIDMPLPSVRDSE